MTEKRWDSPNQIVVALINFWRKKGRFPSAEELDSALREAYPSSRDVKNVFGKLQRAKKEARKSLPAFKFPD